MSEAQNPLWAVVGNRGFEPSDRPVPWLFNHMSDAQGKADHLNRFDNTNQYYAAPVFVVRKEWVKAVQDRADLARAQVAEAYERAAEAAYQWWNDDDAQELRDHIRALIPADAKAALDAMLKAERAKAFKEAEEICTNIIKKYDVMKADGKTYEPLRVQKAAKGMVSLAREDIRALAQEDE